MKAIRERTRASLDLAPVRFARAVMREVDEDDVAGMAAELAYRMLFALFPLLLFAVAVVGMLGGVLGRDDLVRQVVQGFSGVLPAAVAGSTEEVVRALVEQSRTYALVGLAVALWGGASGISVLIKSLSRAYDVAEPRAGWKRTLTSLAAALLVPPIALTLIVLSVGAQLLASLVGDLVGVAGGGSAALWIVQVTLTSIVFMLLMAAVYKLLPAARQRFRDVLPGALLATAAWIVLSQAFGVYIGQLDGYEATYGAFAAAVVFLLWLYFVSFAILVGAEHNALLSRQGRGSWSVGRGD